MGIGEVGASATLAGGQRLLAGSTGLSREERTLEHQREHWAPNAPGLHHPKMVEVHYQESLFSIDLKITSNCTRK